ncbi:MAG: hypothetical protein CVT99_09535 [Bacteroidetes bacterium HGW-Bacteroidetes-16]|nr:MAG: hypothetical protein CVT99_09535 [Bacteroidetes bacterium HGW-Bacteroidetes-16]
MVGVASYVIQTVFPVIGISTYWPWILLFMFCFTNYVYWQLLKQFYNRISRFTNTLMLINFGKLFLYTLIIAVFSWFNKDQAISFAITFFVYYMIITFFEIKALLNLK